jgi:hypothetical protein
MVRLENGTGAIETVLIHNAMYEKLKIFAKLNAPDTKSQYV